jgi:AI-2 transport protein TqsA
MQLERGAKTLVVLAAFVMICFGIKETEAGDIIVPFLVAGFITSITAPLVFWMRDHHVPTSIAVALALILDVAVLVGVGAAIGSSLGDFFVDASKYGKQLDEVVANSGTWLGRFGVERNQITEAISAKVVMEQFVVLFQSMLGAVSKTIFVLIIVMFMLFEAVGIKTKLAHVFGLDENLERLRRAARQVNRYMLVKTVTSLGTGVLVGIWCAIWGIEYAVLWAVLAFLLNYIPQLGSLIACIPPTLLAIVQIGPGEAIGFVAGYTVFNFVIGNILEPRMFGQTLGISPLVAFLSILFWGWLLGPLGALFSVPLTMIVKIYLLNTEDLRWIALLLAPSARIADGSLSIPPPPPLPRVEPSESAPPAE